MMGERPFAAEQRGSQERGGGGGARPAGGMSRAGGAGRALAALLLAASVLSAALLAPGGSPTPGECALRPGPRGGDCPLPGAARGTAREEQRPELACRFRRAVVAGPGLVQKADPREDAGRRERRSSGFKECL